MSARQARQLHVENLGKLIEEIGKLEMPAESRVHLLDVVCNSIASVMALVAADGNRPPRVVPSVCVRCQVNFDANLEAKSSPVWTEAQAPDGATVLAPLCQSCGRAAVQAVGEGQP